MEKVISNAAKRARNISNNTFIIMCRKPNLINSSADFFPG